ncbi:MAG: hypothetical protein L3J84_14000 [Gammaproteobacteria bacterium]|nr:hypothetical protein [Gammaproteobacteria bacterium]
MIRKNKQYRYKPGFLAVSGMVVILIFVVMPLITLTYISDSYALVKETENVDVDSAIKIKKIARQLYGDLINPSSSQRSEITISQNEINGIIALAMRGFKKFKGRVNVTPIGIKGAFTFYVPQNPFGDYINLAITIDPSPNGLVINNVSIGSLEISGTFALSVAETSLNILSKEEKIGTLLINAIESIQVKNSKLHLVYHPIIGLRQAINKTKGKVKEIRDDLALLGDPKIVKRYYQMLCEFHEQISGIGNVPLGYYLSSAFSFAEKRSLAGEKPEAENQAALLALAIFLGSANFDSVIGAIDKKTFQRCPPAEKHIVLADRNDLRLHFIFSAALKIISDSGLSFAIGEFKELLDSQQGGSGFSFVDLAADRAGIRFAELALDDSTASHIQRMASELTEENIFFPSIIALPEGIPRQVFAARGGIESNYYKEYLATINARINHLPLYKKIVPVF